MKKLLLTLAFLLISTQAFAQYKMYIAYPFDPNSYVMIITPPPHYALIDAYLVNGGNGYLNWPFCCVRNYQLLYVDRETILKTTRPYNPDDPFINWRMVTESLRSGEVDVIGPFSDGTSLIVGSDGKSAVVPGQDRTGLSLADALAIGNAINTVGGIDYVETSDIYSGMDEIDTSSFDDLGDGPGTDSVGPW